MTSRYEHWLAQLAERDAVIATLALCALCVVLAWELLRVLPGRIANRVRPLYLAGGLLLCWGSVLLIYILNGGKS